MNLSPLESEFLFAVHNADQCSSLHAQVRSETRPESSRTPKTTDEGVCMAFVTRRQLSAICQWNPKDLHFLITLDYIAYRRLQENIEKNQRDRAQKDKQKADQASLKSRPELERLQLSNQVL